MRASRASFLVSSLIVLAGCGDETITSSTSSTSSSTSSSSSTSTSSGMPSACSVDAVAGLAVAPTDFYGGTPYALGYPSYAIDGCRLVYLAPSADGLGAGALRLRDLASGDEQTIAEAAEQPRRPSIAGEWIVWEATVAGAPGVRVKGATGDAVTIEGAFDHAGEPRAGEDAVVFTGWLGPKDTDDTDIFLYRPDTKIVAVVGGGAKQQRFADISATHLAWTDFSDDASGYYKDAYNPSDEADVVVFDRVANVASKRHRPGKQAFPILGAKGKVAYLDWVGVQPEPKLDGYALQIANLGAPVETDALVSQIYTPLIHVRPVARGALIEWVGVSVGQQSQMLRQAADLQTPAVVLPGLEGMHLVGPTASDAITLVGVQQSAGPVELRAFAR
ncbi:MAG: hypothetical protein ABJE95_19045 [Byssovorax sp.]